MHRRILAAALAAALAGLPGPAAAQATLDRVVERFRAAYAGTCQSADPSDSLAAEQPELYRIAFRYDYETESDPEHEVQLFDILCGYGAYNEMRVFYLVNEYDEITAVSFAEPSLDIDYENDDFEGAVLGIRIRGMASTSVLINAFYDPATRTVTSHSKWRGLGDASSSGQWLFHNGRFILKSYDADASYDGEINPQTVLDYGQ